MKQVITTTISDFKANEAVVFALENPVLSTIVCISCAAVGLLLGVITQYYDNKNLFA